MTTTPDITPATRAHLLWLAAQPGFEGLREPCKHETSEANRLVCFRCGAEWVRPSMGLWEGGGYVLPSAPECLWRLMLATVSGDKALVLWWVEERKEFNAVIYRGDAHGDMPLAAISLAAVRALGGPE